MFKFEVSECNGLLNNQIGEITFNNGENYVVKWFSFRKVNNVITMSNNNEPFKLKVFGKFIESIDNNADVVYIRDNQVIFELKDNIFKVNANTFSTRFNFDPVQEFSYDLSNETIKNELTDTLLEIYRWMYSIIYPE